MRIQSQISPHITIEAISQSHINKAETALQRLASKPNGACLLDEIKRFSKNGRSLRINVVDATINTSVRAALTTKQAKAHNLPVDDLNPRSYSKAVALANKKGFLKGEGTSAIIDWNPAQYPDIANDGRPRLVENEELAFVSLAHEIVHGYRIMKGTFTGGQTNRYSPGTPAAAEEARAVGIGKYSGESLSENGVRQEHNLPLRAYYRAASPVIEDDLSNMSVG
ncbi:XopG/HopH/AvrPtoH family type III secretion system effector [Pseudomonas agarici]|uniref:XopG/HopH/AvrPtoH family type III secretion system effector n=1 Tax=Pseudomonas agarici TaxID=46677 RepID=UPI0009E691AA|nr:XopG/HopH/AvrPtoH family type III secretion system effector [Pseudomonas agarici]NWB93174.1 hypothetical protein [Pseudomonas agarici]